MTLPTTPISKKKPWYTTWWAITIAILVVLMIIGGIARALGFESPREATPVVPETTEAAAPSEEPAEAAETEEPEPTQATEEEPAETEETEPTQPATKTLDGLDVITAQIACENFGNAYAYPDKLKIHTILGKKQEIIGDHEIRFLWAATLESSAGGELKGEVLCAVTGTDNAPIVEVFEFR